MAKTNTQKKSKQQKDAGSPEPWLSMKSGVIIITFMSIFMAVMTGIEAVPAKGWIEGILWSLLFGAMIWAVFFVVIFVNRFLKR